ncbi:MAG TPA: peptidoglycan editing factor PgeF [Bryobacteraceae bacterium]|nr:peptidoglycan editing factor PgeF [Bryobacteraceae bacterium]
MITAPVFAELDWLIHGFGLRDSTLPAEIRLAKQIHSSIVLDAGDCGKEGDALTSREPGVLVGVRTADCVPILVADPVTRAVAAVHAGWRGTAENIVAAALGKLGERFGVRPENVIAAIGPSIGPCCYEVGPEVAVRFGASGTGKAHVDLPHWNEVQLREAGVRTVWKSGECTFCAAQRFFSFRREREAAGRMVSFIGQRQK